MLKSDIKYRFVMNMGRVRGLRFRAAALISIFLGAHRQTERVSFILNKRQRILCSDSRAHGKKRSFYSAESAMKAVFCGRFICLFYASLLNKSSLKLH